MAENRLGNNHSGQTGLLQSCDGACWTKVDDRLTAKRLGSEASGDGAMTVMFPDGAGVPAADGCRVEYDRTV